MSMMKYQYVSNTILTRISRGELKPGYRLPSVRTLARELDVNHLTICRAIERLVDDGVIETRPRVGNFVKSPAEPTNVAFAFPDYLLKGESQHPVVGITLNGLNRIMKNHEYVISSLFYRPGQFREDVCALAIKRKIRGLVLWPDSTIDIKHVQYLIDEGLQIVLTQQRERLFPGLDLISVSIDTSMALAQILERLDKLGHKKIVVALYVYHPMRQRLLDTINEFCQRTHGHSAGKMVYDIINTPRTMPDYESVLPGLLDGVDRPTAVVLIDEIGAGALFRLCYERDIKIPEQLSIAALNDNAPYVHPVPLTAPNTVKLNMVESLQIAKYLHELLLGKQPLIREVRLRCDVEWKASVGPAAM